MVVNPVGMDRGELGVEGEEFNRHPPPSLLATRDSIFFATRDKVAALVLGYMLKQSLKLDA